MDRQEGLHRTARIYELLALILVEDMSSERDEFELVEATAELMRYVREDGKNGTLDIGTWIEINGVRVSFSGTLAVTE